jgi:hypothetical protein
MAFENTLKSFTDSIAKYGKYAVILVLLYYAIRKVWAWIALPILLLISVRMVCSISNVAWAQQISVVQIVCAWVFALSIIRGLFFAVFEKK